MYAFTDQTPSYPPYINVTRNADGSVRVLVRSPCKEDGSCGDSACIILDRSEFDRMKKSMETV